LTKKVTLDSSVIITSVLDFEKRHKEAMLLFENILIGNYEVFLPYTVLVEVIGAVKRRTLSDSQADQIKEKLLGVAYITFIELTSERAENACQIASQFNLRGMDAIVVQVSKEFGTELITFDKEMLSRISNS
jgi:predicted nucleic acid-binding protein